MKKRILLASLFVLSFTTTKLKAQSYSQSFDNFAGLTADGWSFNNLSTPIGTTTWMDGNAGAVFPGFLNNYISVNYNSVAGANTISNWMISPVTTLSNGSVITFYSRTVDAPSFPDRLQVRLSTNGASTNVGTTNTSVGDFTTILLDINPTLTTAGYPNTWTQYSVTLSGLPGTLTGRIAFRYFVTNGGPTGANSDYIGIDEFVYTDNSVPPTPNLAVLSVNKEYTSIPLEQAVNMPLGGTIRNVSPTTAATDAQLSVNVYQAPNFTTPVFTQSSTPAALAANTSSTVSVGSYTPTAVGQYRFQYVSTCTGNTVASNDTMNYDIDITSHEYARDNGNVVGALGIGASEIGNLGNKFTIHTTNDIDSVLAVFNKTGIGFGDSTRIEIYNFAAGLPSTKIGTSPIHIFTAADTLTGLDSYYFPITDLSGNPLQLTPGDYLVSVVEYNQNVEICNTDLIFTANTVFVKWPSIPGGTWANVETFGGSFAKPFVIRPFLSPICIPTSSTDIQTSCGPITWIDGNTYSTSNNTAQFVLTNAAGCDSTVTLNLTVNTPYSITDTHVICGSYTWIDGNTYTTSNNTAQMLLTSVGGCDSLVTLDLTITSVFNVTDNQTACDSYSWIDGNTYTASNNTAQVTLTSSAGCDSIVTLNLVITSTPIASAIDNGDFTATASGGSSYQWMDCATGQIIAGETNANYAPNTNGSYAAIVSNGSCVDTTNCVVIAGIGINELATNSVKLYPNPTSGNITINFDAPQAFVTITDSKGRVINSITVLTNEIISLDSLQAGTYFFEIQTENGVSIQRIIKK